MTNDTSGLPDIHSQIQAILVEVLAVDPDEAIPEANFFDDLQGESIDVLDLIFQCEKAFGVRAPFKELTMADPSFVDQEGYFTATGIAALTDRCPWLDPAALTDQTPRTLFTVGFMTRVMQQAIVGTAARE